MFFPQYHAEGSCAGAGTRVVHSNCAGTARSVNNRTGYILHIRAINPKKLGGQITGTAA